MSANTANSVYLSKKVLVLFGSPHKDGYTAKMLEHFLEFVPKSCKIDVIDAYEYDIKPCIDCKYCTDNFGCMFDDFEQLDELYRDADVIVIATPVYNLSFPAPLKAIFDRTQQYFNDRFHKGIKPVIKKEKKAIALISSGSNSYDGTEIIEKQLNLSFSIMNTQLISTIAFIGTDSGNCFDDIKRNIKETVENKLFN